VDVRFVAATNQDLEKMVAKGTFRKDLYYRLKGTWVQLPPLRERREDIPLLAERFLEEFRGSEETIEIDDDAMSILLDFDYPGNIRELRSIIQSAVNLAQGKPITVNCLPGYLQSRKVTLKTNGTIVPLESIEKDHILKAYDATSKNKVQTARILGIGLNTLRRKLEAYGVD
jgi:transcriptional regulator with PAS, ATPase and Fis domain